MQILKFDEKNNAYFQKNETDLVKIMNLDKVALLDMLENIFDNKEYYSFENEDNLLNEIKNPVEKEIARQIISKLKEFKNQVDSMKAEIESKYPLDL